MDSVFKPSINCWRTNSIRQGAPLIDCANFYRAFHEAVRKAQHSIFILGWEIDSRVRLLRGEEEKNSPCPSVAVDLLAWAAKRNPNLQIYLLRWDSSLAFIGQRELMAEYVWSAYTPENVHICLDDTIPLGGSHHQKIVLIDDELVFLGGMDIARQRWDERQHRIQETERTDANGPYGPYHDVQVVLHGDITADFAELVRWRWRNAAGYEAVPVRKTNPNEPPPTWPESAKPLFGSMDCAIARTLPELDQQKPIYEVEQMYLDLIEQAKDFIYIENQFFTCDKIARALNQKLKQNRKLRALLVSSFNPQGIFESEGLWSGRIDFKKILEAGVPAEQVRIVCSGIDAQGQTHYKRIHSKVMSIDDHYLVIGSANIANRSMRSDTECDIILEGETDEQRQQIQFMRADLIAEHTGRSPEQVQDLFNRKASLDEIMKCEHRETYCLREIDDSQFTSGQLPIVQQLADPKKSLIPFGNPRKSIFVIGAMAILAIWALIIFSQKHLEWFRPENIKAFMEMSRSSAWALPLVCGVYVVGGLILFPVTVLSLMVAAIFGPLWGPLYGMCGALVSAALMFGLGHLAGLKGLRRLLGERVRKVDYHFQKSGIIGVAAIRLLPIAPYSIVNLAAGISSVRFFDFIVGSFLGFLPAFIAKGIVGDSMTQVFLDPSAQKILYLVLGLMAWFALVGASYYLAKKWQARRAL